MQIMESARSGSVTSDDDDRAAVEALLMRMSEAWNAGDADAYGALYTEDASLVT
jgi:ketosteroid isomerase-like protein